MDTSDIGPIILVVKLCEPVPRCLIDDEDDDDEDRLFRWLCASDGGWPNWVVGSWKVFPFPYDRTNPLFKHGYEEAT